MLEVATICVQTGLSPAHHILESPCQFGSERDTLYYCINDARTQKYQIKGEDDFAHLGCMLKHRVMAPIVVNLGIKREA